MVMVDFLPINFLMEPFAERFHVLGLGGGIGSSDHAFYSDDPSSNPAGYYFLIICIVPRKDKLNEK